MLLKGNIETCYELFREAVKKEDVIAQIQLSHALYGIKWGKDDKKDFSSLVVGDLEDFFYYPKRFVLFNLTYDEAMGEKSDWKTKEARAVQTFQLAADHNYLPAFLELMDAKWRSNINTYGFAVQLRPFIGQGDKTLDYFFGQALKNGCRRGCTLYYEGLHWMNQSLGIRVKYPAEEKLFENLKRKYRNKRKYNCYELDGFLHIGNSTILAPSKKKWDHFVKEKLNKVTISPPESYIFNHDYEIIKSLLLQHDIEIVSMIADQYYKLSIHQDEKRIGEILVHEDTFEILKSIENSNIQPVIQFIESVMKRTGSSESAICWLDQMCTS